MAFNRPASLSCVHATTRLAKFANTIVVALALGALSLAADAAGLGRLNLLSGLGQPLRAEIDLTSVNRDEAGSLVAKLAGADTFSRANIEYGAALNGLRFSIQRRANGQPFVQITSAQPVNEPYLDLLVELTWNSGRLVREYTMLLDPPESKTARRDAEPIPVVVAPAAARARPSRSDATRSGSASNRSGAATGSAGAGAASGGDYQVRRGDTLGAIARSTKPEGVALDQMLAALFRANPQAFDGNINRLKSGVILRVPDATTVQSVERDEARRFVTAQTGDFSGYRTRIASAAGQAHAATRGAGQQASGKLTARVDETGSAAENKDRLRLSKAEAQKNAAALSASGARIGAAGTGPTAEDLATKERALQEADARVALLEKNVADLQKLVELKNQNLAELQKQAQASAQKAAADSATAPPAPPSAATAAATNPAPPSAPVSAPAPAPTPSATVPSAPAAGLPPPPTPVPPAAEAPAVVPPAAVAPSKPVVPAAPVNEPGWFDQLRDNPLLFGLAVIVVLLIGYGLYNLQRRRKFSRFEDSILTGSSALRANSVFGTTGGQSVDTSNSGFHSNFVPVAGAASENEVDPVAEADVYIAYGRDAQAEEILKESLRAHPERHAVRLKLLEIYAKRGDTKAFETVASELYASTGGQGPDWKHALTLGASIDPTNPLYRESVAMPPAIGGQHATTDFDRTRSMPAMGGALGAMEMTGAAALAADSAAPGTPPMTDSGFTRTAFDEAPLIDLTRTDPLPKQTAEASTMTPAMDLDFDLGLGAGTASRAAGATPEAHPDSQHGAAGLGGVSTSGGIDFDLGERRSPPQSLANQGESDAAVRTAVNLPAFRQQSDPLLDAPAFAPTDATATDGFTASDIFGSSLSAATEPAFEAPAPAPAPAPPPSQSQEYGQFDKTEPFDALSGINLDLDNGTFSDATRAPTDLGVPDIGSKTGAWQAMSTKLDLAAAYRDIGDADGARELLEEVIRNGDATQAEQARRLIGELG